MIPNEHSDPNLITVTLKEIKGLTAFIEYAQTGEICHLPVHYVPEDCKIGDTIYLKISKSPNVMVEETEAVARKLLEKFINPQFA